MYIKIIQINQYVILILYTDTSMLTGNATEELNHLKISLQTKYQISALGTLSLYIGLEL